MTDRYLPKIKTDTAKAIIKDLITTKSGKKISDTRFKNILKKEKNLQKFAYGSSTSRLTKQQTHNFLNKVAKKISVNDKLKISPIKQKKLGLAFSKKGELTRSGIKKIYQRAVDKELDAQQPAGPSPEELRRQKKRQTAIKTLHKHERAREVEQDANPQQNSKRQSQEKNVAPPPLVQGTAAAAAADKPSSASTIKDSDTAPSPGHATQETETALILIFPIDNKADQKKETEWLIKQIQKVIVNTFSSYASFRLVSQKEIDKVFESLRLTSWPEPEEKETIRTIAHESKADLYVTGTYDKQNDNILLHITITNTATQKRMPLVTINEEVNDPFELERKIAWHINHALQTDNEDRTNDSLPGPISDLPI